MSVNEKGPVTKAWTQRQIGENLNRVLGPAICQELMLALKKNQVDFADIANILQRDPFVSAKVIGMANIVKAPGQPEVTSVTRAVQMLGLRKVRVLVMSVMLAGPLLEPDEGVTRRQDLWRWVISCGIAGNWIGRHVFAPVDNDVQGQGEWDDPTGHAAEHMVSGLVMGLGALVLYSGLGRTYARVLGLPIRPIDLATRACDAIGVSHHQVTSWALEALRCPASIATYSNVLASGEDGPSAQIGRAIELLGARIAGYESDAATVKLIDKLEVLQIDPTRLFGPALKAMRQRVSELASVFGGIGDDAGGDKITDAQRRETLQASAAALEDSLDPKNTLRA